MKRWAGVAGITQVPIRMSADDHTKLRKMLIDDQMSFQELMDLFLQSYLRGDRISRLLINGHRDARVVPVPKGNGVLTQREKDDIIRELEKGNG